MIVQEWVRDRMIRLDDLLSEIEITIRMKQHFDHSDEETLKQIGGHIASFKKWEAERRSLVP